jgi:VanZ family protein
MLSWWLKSPRVQLLALVWTLFIVLASITPGSELPKVQLPGLDKLVHIVIYAMLAFLWMKSLRIKDKKKQVLGVFTTVVLFGISIEWIQGALIEGRSGDGYDAIANSIGAGLGIVISRRLD